MNNPLADCQKLADQRLYKEALDILQPWTLQADVDPKEVGPALTLAVECFQSLNRAGEIDAYRESVIQVHEKNWRLLQAAADSYQNGNHLGTLIDGKFERTARYGRNIASAQERDRVRALQLMQQAAELATGDNNKTEVAEFFFVYAAMWKSGREHTSAWKFQNLTDLTTLPDYEERYRGYSSESLAPVDAEGNPIYYNSPKSFQEAKNDGERWRWCLDQAVENAPQEYLNKTLVERAQFTLSQFGVETMREYGFFFRAERTKQDSQTWNLHTLQDNETIAKLADGVKRFELPDDQNPIKLYQQVLESGTTREKSMVLRFLAQIYENRRQYPKAAEYWKRVIKDHPLEKDYAQGKYDQIVKNWGRFEPTRSKSAGKGPDLQYLFRNGKSVRLTAQEIRVPLLLDDVKAYIKSKPIRLDWQKLSVDRIGYELVANPAQNAKYLGREVARWVVPLAPAENHFDRRTTITVPVTTSGAYLVKAEMEDGNTDYIVVWLSDTGIVRKQLDNAIFYYIADAETGVPIPNANVEFFGYQLQARSNNQVDYEIKEIAEKSNADGQLILGNNRITQKLQWLVTVTTPAQGNTPGRFAYLGFSNVWYSPRHDQEYNEVKAFFISDRPVYRPKETAQYKFWVGTAKYDSSENESKYAGRKAVVEIHSPRGERIEQELFTLDEYGGLVGQLALPADAMLGEYRLSVFAPGARQEDGSYKQIRYYGSGSFRVEEYKKPEYEVQIEAPTEPVALGEPITAKIKANYYFGSPVVNATVKYKVIREKYDETWYPLRPWDWFYGRGYAWFAYDYDWYPGWNLWGTCRPVQSWFPRRSFGPPEVIQEKEVPIGADGTVDVKFDTAFTKEIYPNDNQKYTITAEVVDQSRRTIVGTGTVLVAREPLKVYAWVDRGYYEPNQQINAHFQARRLDGKPVGGDTIVKVYKINYAQGKAPTETEVHSAAVKLGEDGSGRITFNAAEPGQYRVSALFSRYSAEGAYIFNVYGPAQTGTGSFTFNQLELIPNKEEFRPGEEVELRINTNRPDTTVLLFSKPANGVYLAPQIVKLRGKSASVKIPVLQKDMPNFFVEAVCVSGGEVYTEMKELAVPPEKRIVNVEVTPSAETFKPGEKAKAKLTVTDQSGKPVVGQTVVSIYDKSVEYISGGSNVEDIKEFFWKWRRHHHPNTVSSLTRYFHNFPTPDKPTLQFLGIFGASVADEVGQFESDDEGDGNMVESASFDGDMAPAAMPMAQAPMGMGGGDMRVESMISTRKQAFTNKMAGRSLGEGGTDSGTPLVEATVRKEFADTALWVGVLETNQDGVAEIDLTMPDNLTTWKINVWAMGHGTRVGYGSSEVITRKDLIIRMQTPRFLVQKDQVMFTANVHNYLATEKNVQVSLELAPGIAGILPASASASPLTLAGRMPAVPVLVPAGGEARVDWL
ncbi:MAG: MG2 domain-containing protein, partial [Planctomycetaceae bacterium]|nr:MG2 domain-containing protein [Planctomycetaceae bacterium]